METLYAQLQNILIASLYCYVVPTIICVVFAIVYHRENPFRKDNCNTRQYVFMPAVNLVIMCAIIFILLPRSLFVAIDNGVKKFREWKKKLY